LSAGWVASDVVRRHATAAGAEPAVIDGASVVTWAELDARAETVAGRLAAAGVPAGGVVGVPARASAETIAAIVGVLRAGAAAAPIPESLTRSERAAVMALLDPMLVVDEPGAARPGRVLDVAGIVVPTSGTTGRPRGVVLPDASISASADAWLAALPPATGWVLALGLGHVAGLGVVWRAIAGRVPVRIVPAGDPGALVAALRAAPAASHVSLVPAQLARALDLAGDEAPPPTLRAVLLGGGTIAETLVTRALGAGWPVMPTYGLSEAASGVTALATDEVRDAPGTAGRPLPGVRLWIDAPDEHGIGEIVVSSPAAFAGYVGEPPRTPDQPIRTGDLGRLDAAGRLVVVDRRTDLVVRGGENVSPAEVEAVLLGHPAITDAAVVGRPDPVWGHVPVAAIVLDPDAPDPGDEELLGHCRASLGGFKVPADVLRLDTLPRTPGGKLRREAVRALVDGSRSGILARPGGDAIGWRVTGDGPVAVLLLPGTLSTAAQLDGLAASLAGPGDVTVHALDRRGSGTSRLGDPVPLDVAVHVSDTAAYLDARRIPSAVVVGASYGGALALELAARLPGRVTAVVAWEPPYGPLADEPTRAAFAALAAAVEVAHRTRGAGAAAETFMRAVAGEAAWDRLPQRSRAFLAGEGDGALADAALAGLDPDGLARIVAPVTLLTGGASEPFYQSIADALIARIPGARREVLDGLAHPAPITHPARFAAAVRACLEPAP